MNPHFHIIKTNKGFYKPQNCFYNVKKAFNTKGYRIPKHVFKHYLNIYINNNPSKTRFWHHVKQPPHDSKNYGRRSANRTLPQRKKTGQSR